MLKSDGLRPKIFLIGFNKCGTKTFHHVFRSNGYRSVHCRTRLAKLFRGKTIAQTMADNLAAQKPILDGVDKYDIYGDLIHLTRTRLIEANSYFKELDQQYPGSYFIFNDRPVEHWIASRLKHEAGPYGSLIDRYMAATGLTRDQSIVRWRSGYEEHKALVADYFRGNPRFLIFNIEADDPACLNDFLKGNYVLDTSRWPQKGSSSRRESGKLR